MAEQDPNPAVPPPPPSLKSILQTFSDEAQESAKKKAIASGFSLTKGSIPFEETLINLSRSRDTLLKSIESSAITQLPLKVQRHLFSETVKVSSQLQALMGGADAVLPFEGAVEDLITAIWYSGVENLSGEILGLHEKLNQLKSLERVLREFKTRADAFEGMEVSTRNLSAKLLAALTESENYVQRLS
jgi:hypothetical protein